MSRQGEVLEVKGRKIMSFYHRPRGALRRNSSVLLVKPGYEDREVSVRLADHLIWVVRNDGFAVYEFDFYGTGESEGETGSGRIRYWVEDCSAMMKYVQRKCGHSKIHLIGMRLGASIAMEVSRGFEPHSLVLLDPVLNGRAYLSELKRRSYGTLGIKDTSSNPYPENDSHIEELKSINMVTSASKVRFAHMVKGGKLFGAQEAIAKSYGIKVHKYDPPISWEKDPLTVNPREVTQTIRSIVRRPYAS